MQHFNRLRNLKASSWDITTLSSKRVRNSSTILASHVKHLTIFLNTWQRPCQRNAAARFTLKTMQLLVTLIKLRLDIQFEYLADQIGLAKSCCHDIFKRWINLLYAKLKFSIKWPDHDATTKMLPHAFRQYFPRLTGIIDCTEFFIDRPKNVKDRAQV